jgi:hypothetical protein
MGTLRQVEGYSVQRPADTGNNIDGAIMADLFQVCDRGRRSSQEVSGLGQRLPRSRLLEYRGRGERLQARSSVAGEGLVDVASPEGSAGATPTGL